MIIVLSAAEYSWPNYAGGIKTYTQVCARNLVRLGHEVHIITSETNGFERKYQENGVFIHEIGVRRLLPRNKSKTTQNAPTLTKNPNAITDLLEPIYLLRRSFRIRSEILSINHQNGVDLVEVPDWGAEGFGSVIFPFKPVIVTLHAPSFLINKINQFPRTTGRKVSEYLEKQSIIRSKVIISPSYSMQEKILQQYQKPSLGRKIVVIPNPVQTSLFKPNPQTNHANSIIPSITFIGRMEFNKGIHILASAIPKIKAEIKEVRFIFIGGDTMTAPSGGSMRSYISAQLDNYKDSFEFKGTVPHEMLPNYLSNSAIVVVPSFEETFSYTCAEAMACGACVIASRVGGLEELIIDGDTGYLIPAGNSDELSRKIIHLLKSPEERKIIGEQARKYIHENMSEERIIDQKLLLYKQVLS